MSDHNEPTQGGALPSVPLQPVVQLLIRLYEDYVELLGEELNELAPFSAVHGWKSKRAEKGKEYRASIAELKSQWDARGHADCIADFQRVVEWAKSKNRKPAQLAFTAGPERQAAYWIEWAEINMPNPGRQPPAP